MEAIGPIVADLKVALVDVTAKVKLLVGLPLEEILCTVVGDVLDAAGIAKLLACLFNVGALDLVPQEPLTNVLYSSSSVPALPSSSSSPSLSRPNAFLSSLISVASSAPSSAPFSAWSAASSPISLPASFPRLLPASASLWSCMSRSSLSFSVSASASRGEVNLAAPSDILYLSGVLVGHLSVFVITI